uniref:PH domain-containing protein n=1 Tax=Macrostomum lignano TaxID=282301 RepID=A0A1I8IWC2_9PLAT
ADGAAHGAPISRLGDAAAAAAPLPDGAGAASSPTGGDISRPAGARRRRPTTTTCSLRTSPRASSTAPPRCQRRPPDCTAPKKTTKTTMKTFEDEDGRYKDYVNAGNKDYKEFKDSGLEEADAAMSPTARSLVASSSGVSSADPSAAELQQQRQAPPLPVVRHQLQPTAAKSAAPPAPSSRKHRQQEILSGHLVWHCRDTPPAARRHRAHAPCCCRPAHPGAAPTGRRGSRGPDSHPLRLVECCSAQFDFAQNPRLLCLSFAGGRTLLLEAPSGEAKQLWRSCITRRLGELSDGSWDPPTAIEG